MEEVLRERGACVMIADNTADEGKELCCVHPSPPLQTTDVRLQRAALLLLGVRDATNQLISLPVTTAVFKGPTSDVPSSVVGVHAVGPLLVGVWLLVNQKKGVDEDDAQRKAVSFAQQIVSLASLVCQDIVAAVRSSVSNQLFVPIISHVLRDITSSCSPLSSTIPTTVVGGPAESQQDMISLVTAFQESQVDGFARLPRFVTIVSCLLFSHSELLCVKSSSAKNNSKNTTASLVDFLKMRGMLPRSKDMPESVETVDVFLHKCAGSSDSAMRFKHKLVVVGVNEFLLCVVTVPCVPEAEDKPDPYLVHDARMLIRRLDGHGVLSCYRDFSIRSMATQQSKTDVNAAAAAEGEDVRMIKLWMRNHLQPKTITNTTTEAANSVLGRSRSTMLMKASNSDSVGSSTGYTANPTLFSSYLGVPSDGVFNEIKLTLRSGRTVTGVMVDGLPDIE